METRMSNLRKVLLASVLGASCAVIAAPAVAADFGFSFNTGDVAFAYRDGYWDRYHRWHYWHDRDQWRWYRAHYGNSYYDWDHDRYGDNGWHDRGWHRGWYHHDWRDRDRYYDNRYNNDNNYNNNDYDHDRY